MRAGGLRIDLSTDAQSNPFAVRLAERLERLVEADPERVHQFDALRGSVGIIVSDVDLCVTLRSTGGGVTIDDGIVGVSDIVWVGDSESLGALAEIPWYLGPDVLWSVLRDARVRRATRCIVEALRTGRLRLVGGAYRPLMCWRALSVLGEPRGT